MKNLITSLIVIVLVTALGCSSCKKDVTDPNNLPPTTQDGKNTFGFLLNGQAWTPQGNNGTGNLSLNYDATFSGGVFNLSAYRNVSSSNGQRQSLIMYGDSIQSAQKIILPNIKKFGFDFWDEGGNCTYSSSDPTTILLSGFFDIKKLDKVNRIFSGEFELKFKKNGCEDVEISQGRFDMKF